MSKRDVLDAVIVGFIWGIAQGMAIAAGVLGAFWTNGWLP